MTHSHAAIGAQADMVARRCTHNHLLSPCCHRCTGLICSCLHRRNTPTEPAAADVQTHDLHRLLLACACEMHSQCCCEMQWLCWHCTSAHVGHSTPDQPATLAAGQALAPLQAWLARHISVPFQHVSRSGLPTGALVCKSHSSHQLPDTNMCTEPVAVQALAPAPAWQKGAPQA